jgi:outer membrane protein assembly factor BamA
MITEIYKYNKHSALIMCLILLLLFSIGNAQQVLQEYNFYGNKRFDSDQLLDWSGLATAGPISSVLISAANKKIISGYQSEGYLYARIDSTVLSESSDAKYVSVSWHLNEGTPVNLGSVELLLDSLDAEDLENMIDFREGDIYRSDLIESELKVIARFFADRGYPLATINVNDTRMRTEDGVQYIDLKIHVKAGPAIMVNKIILRGNQVTEDEVILREIGVNRGTSYNQEKIDEIPQQLLRLGYFDQVKPVRIIDAKEEKTNLLIEVVEGNTTTFDGIVGYIPPTQGETDQDGFFTGLINLNFRNLFGSGRKFEVYWRKQDRFSEEFKLY